MGSVGAVVEIVSDDEEILDAVRPPNNALVWSSHLQLEDIKGIGEGLYDSSAMQEFLASLEGEKKSVLDAGGGGGGGDDDDDDDDDDCILLDGDPVKALVVAKEKRPGEDGSEEELQIVAEKGEVACRDFPHPRHLCASLPFSTSSHANHCNMCHCYVCDSPAPCPYWGKATLLSDHCHASDKDEKWKKLRQLFKRKSKPASNRGSIQNFLRSSSTPPSSLQYTAHQLLVPQPFPPSRTNVIQPSAGIVPVASVPQPFPPARGNVIQPSARRVPVASAPQPFPPSRANVIQPSARRVPVASAPQPFPPSRAYVIQPSARRVPVASVPQPFPPSRANVVQPTDRRVPVASAPQPFPPSRTNVVQPSAGRVTVASNVSQNQQTHPSIRVAQNAVQVAHVPKALPSWPKISGKRFKRSGAAPPVYTPPDAGHLQPPVPNYVPMQPASSHVLQTAQVAPRSNVVAGNFQGFTPQHYLNAPSPVVSRGRQVQQASHLQVAPGREVGTELQLFPCSTPTINGTQCVQDPSADISQRSWQDALAKLAFELGVSDYNINPPHGQLSASTQSLHPSQLPAQVKASQVVESRPSLAAATSQVMPFNERRLPNHEPGDGVVANGCMQPTQPLCLLNYESSLTPSETPSPAMKH